MLKYVVAHFERKVGVEIGVTNRIGSFWHAKVDYGIIAFGMQSGFSS